MDCCNAFGQCKQGHGCPVRGAASTTPRTCDQLGACNGSGNCPQCPNAILLPVGEHLAPGEAGNFWIHSAPIDDEPLTLREVVAWCLFLLLCGGACAAVVGFSTGWTVGSLWP